MGRPPKYPAEFGREAIELVKTSGRPWAEVVGGWRWGEPDGDGRAPYAEMRRGPCGSCQWSHRR